LLIFDVWTANEHTKTGVALFRKKRLETHGVYDKDSKLLDCVVQAKIASKLYWLVMCHLRLSDICV